MPGPLIGDPFELPDTQKPIRDTVGEFARKELAPRAAEIDEKGAFNHEIFGKMAALGLTGIPVPEDLDGAGLDILSFIITLEEIARVCGSTCLGLAAHTSLGTMPIVDIGSPAQKKRYVPALARGEKIGAYGLTEPGAGSDSGSTASRAVLSAGSWKLNGSKLFMTNASVAASMIVTAVPDPDKPKHGRISAFIVEPAWKGVTVAKKEDKLGCRGSDTCYVTFEDVAVPEANLLGERGQGFHYFMNILNGGRIGIAAMALGLAEGAYDKAVSYAKERRAFGRPIGAHQAVAFMIADMAVGLRAAKHMIYHAARLKDAGRPYKLEASCAKLFASEMAMRVCRDAIQVLGGYGYMSEYGVEVRMRDAKLCEIGEGTSEIQRIVIAREILGKLE